jgi:RNA-dependent RNA polymerase
VRVLRATDVPELRDRGLVNVVVFSKLGQRPEADKASGSDLDGEIFFVSYDARLVPPAGESADPMDYTAGQERDSPKKLTIKVGARKGS